MSIPLPPVAIVHYLPNGEIHITPARFVPVAALWEEWEREERERRLRRYASLRQSAQWTAYHANRG